MDLSVEGKIFVNGTFEQCVIGISDGKIELIKKDLKADSHLNFGNNLILPAGVDAHVHFRDPGLTHKEDFYTGSVAAVFGGISCVFDMPNTIPQTTTITSLSDKIVSAGKKSVVDFGLYAGVCNHNLDDLDKLSKSCNGFKIYLGNTTFSLLFDKIHLVNVLKIASSLDKPVLVHAEDEACLIKYGGTETTLLDHNINRPTECEEISIKDVLNASRGVGSKVHICHVSSCEGLNILGNSPSNVSFGITPHHCLLSVDKSLGSPGFYKVNPPIRTSFDKESLFNAVRNGVVDFVESDHAPHTKDEKSGDFNDIPCGVPGVETMYPLFLFLVKKELISFQKMVSVLCSHPADFLNVPKGRIAVGNDADFIVIDLKNEVKIKSENLHSRCGWSPFEDWPAVFPKNVFIRGEEVVSDNELLVEKGFGCFVSEDN